MSHTSDQDIFAAVEVAWRRAAFRSATRVEPWAFLKLFKAELALELAEQSLERHGHIL